MFAIKHGASTQQESGQTLVEFALVLMFVILPFTAVLIDGAMMLFTLASMTNAAREAAHAGSIYQEGTFYTDPYIVPPGCTQPTIIDCHREDYIKQEEKAFASPLIPFGQCVTTVTYGPTFRIPPDPPDANNIYRALDAMSVKLECPHRLFFSLIGTGQITLTAQSTMKIEPGGLAVPTPTP